MRWLLTIAFVAVAVVSVLKSAEADKHRVVAASKDDDGRRSDSDKEQTNDRAGEKSRERDDESEKRLKEEMEREDERSNSSRFGKSLRASAMEGLTSPASMPQMFSMTQHAEYHSAGLTGHMSGIMLALRSLWSRYVSFQNAALASSHK